MVKLKKNVFQTIDEKDKEMKTRKEKMNDLEYSEFVSKITTICDSKKTQEHLSNN